MLQDMAGNRFSVQRRWGSFQQPKVWKREEVIVAQDGEKSAGKARQERTSIFRAKSLDRISSPEEIDEYMKVTSPSMWLVLGTVFLLLAAALLWSVTGRIETTENGRITEIAPITFLIE